MHPSKNYKLFINPTLAHFVWLTANVHKPSKAGEQQDAHGSGVSPGAAPQAAQGAWTEHCTCQTLLLCTLRCAPGSPQHNITHWDFAPACLGGSRVLSSGTAHGKPQQCPTARHSQEAPAAAAKRQKLSHRDRYFQLHVCVWIYIKHNDWHHP